MKQTTLQLFRRTYYGTEKEHYWKKIGFAIYLFKKGWDVYTEPSPFDLDYLIGRGIISSSENNKFRCPNFVNGRSPIRRNPDIFITKGDYICWVEIGRKHRWYDEKLISFNRLLQYFNYYEVTTYDYDKEYEELLEELNSRIPREQTHLNPRKPLVLT